MSRKAYIKPEISVILMEETLMQAVSGIYSNDKDNGYDIDYGGVDEDGEYIPG